MSRPSLAGPDVGRLRGAAARSASSWLALALMIPLVGCAGGDPGPGAAAGPAAPTNVDWQPPLGIPPPPFGITEQGGAPTHYVDNTHPDASDSGNGTPTRPRRTLPSTLGSGSVLEVRGGPYPVSTLRWTLAGTASSPVFIRGVNAPVLAGDEGLIVVDGSHFVVEGLVLDSVKIKVQEGSQRAVFRRNEIRNWPDSGPTAMISLAGAIEAVVYANHIHHNGNIDSPRELDILGVGTSAGSRSVWVVDNHIHHMAGDSVRVGDNPPEPEPLARFLYIGRNEFHDNQENALDVKLSRDVVVSQNLMYNLRPPASGSDSGTALVVHYGAERVWVLFNRIHSASAGVRCTGAADGFYVIGNVLWNIRHQAGTSYDPASLYGPHAIQAYSTPQFFVINNTVHGSDAGISYPNGSQAEIVNNIVAGLTEATHHVALGTSSAGNLVRNNLFDGEARLRIGSSGSRSCSNAMAAMPGQVQTCLTGDPRFRGPAVADFHLQSGSPAVDAGIDHAAYDRFRQLYGLDIRRDQDGRARPTGSAFDLGAYEAERP